MKSTLAERVAAVTMTEEVWIHLLVLPLGHSLARLESSLGPYKGLTTAFAENLIRFTVWTERM